VADTDIPEDLLYTNEDEWCRVDDDRLVVGVTDYAQQQLGDIVFVELPEVGTRLESGKPFGVIESVKAVSDLYAPVSGEVVAVNGRLADRPELVNESCYEDGWMLAIGRDEDNNQEMDSLLDAEAYGQYVDERAE